MMRIAIAGGGGLGYLIAAGLSQADNAYNVVVLSRTVRCVIIHNGSYANNRLAAARVRGPRCTSSACQLLQ